MHALKKMAKICKNMHNQTETIESLFNDSHRFLKFHMIGVRKKNMLFYSLHKPINYTNNNSESSDLLPIMCYFILTLYEP